MSWNCVSVKEVVDLVGKKGAFTGQFFFINGGVLITSQQIMPFKEQAKDEWRQVKKER